MDRGQFLLPALWVKFIPEQQIPTDGVTPGPLRALKPVSEGAALLPWSPCTHVFLDHQAFQEDGGENEITRRASAVTVSNQCQAILISAQAAASETKPCWQRVPPPPTPVTPVNSSAAGCDSQDWREALLGAVITGAAEVERRAALSLGSVSTLRNKATAQPVFPLI